MTTISATNMDRLFPVTVKLGDGSVLTSQSLYAEKANGSSMASLKSISCNKHTLTPAMIMGELVVCMDGWADGNEVCDVGGVGWIIIDR
ncbi:hypothetical protein PR202_gb21400 [Eleusine coracana subsp. coracana]|uniref:Uncharacterized protein n=1 Tax=Eleusine coracana subsp. coracana TaxID=191504 RepID=A0AAV5FD36_ELECO|nr:hypothetical protein PR202_gb21400 [Eleusine coracana subsp. coracana]